MDTAYVSALSALAGSVVGGLTSGCTTWMSLQSQARIGRQTADLSRRQDLFRDFILAASNAYTDALMSTEPKVHDIVSLWAMVSRMRVLCTPTTAAAAEKVMHVITDISFEPPKTTADLRDLMKKGMGADPMRDFSEAAREELLAYSV
ncbi:MAG TPA: hypothetical protein VMU47_13955 [Caldimonas sp.]|nr:hypothetical protein [Caldimonas sp.]